MRRRFLMLSLGVLCLVGGCGSEAPRERPNVLLITLDTTRRDRLGLYGYERPTSPHLDELASHATVFENAYSTSSWTLPAHASLFTGRYPTSHGMRHDPEGSLILADAIDAPEGIRARSLDAEARTLAEILGDAGYQTGAVVAGPWLIGSFGLARGFEHYDDKGVAAGRRAADVTTSALRWLDDVPEPFLLFLNYFDPHLPYAPPPAYRRSFLPSDVSVNLRSSAQAPSLYDAEILYMDEQLGKLFRSLRERGLYDRTLIVVTADHGELLGDRGEWGHERYLWEPLLRV
ncbi:MAG: sulfatase, partial [Myxococcota bacterium]